MMYSICQVVDILCSVRNNKTTYGITNPATKITYENCPEKAYTAPAATGATSDMQAFTTEKFPR